MSASETSPNFGFLAQHNPLLLQLASTAERYVFVDPNTARIMIRQLAEALAKGVAAYSGISLDPKDTFRDVERELRDRGILDSRV